ncbi:hypothetical protein [Cylindrospermum stagnale]|uniref:hypothetical protein n=1 Tax=Cylindrospermum stagnale TaxID=142864 RepID=UPI0002F9FAA0|nr:hypothetical protein [Cylindrospermum stagnale]
MSKQQSIKINAHHTIIHQMTSLQNQGLKFVFHHNNNPNLIDTYPFLPNDEN